MKALFSGRIYFFTIVFMLSANVSALVVPSYAAADSVAMPYQSVIDKSVALAFGQKSTAPLEAAMMQVAADTQMPGSYKTYWKAYLLYQMSIVQSYILKDSKKAEKTIEKAMALLEEQEGGSEEDALLARCKILAIQFASVMDIPRMSKEIQQHLDNALSADAKNFRAYYVAAENNLYTPPMFGGMEKVETYAEQALACPMTTDMSKYAPAWGKAELYQILIQYYEKKKDEGNKQKYETLRKTEFPYLYQ